MVAAFRVAWRAEHPEAGLTPARRAAAVTEAFSSMPDRLEVPLKLALEARLKLAMDAAQAEAGAIGVPAAQRKGGGAAGGQQTWGGFGGCSASFAPEWCFSALEANPMAVAARCAGAASARASTAPNLQRGAGALALPPRLSTSAAWEQVATMSRASIVAALASAQTEIFDKFGGCTKEARQALPWLPGAALDRFSKLALCQPPSGGGAASGPLSGHYAPPLSPSVCSAFSPPPAAALDLSRARALLRVLWRVVPSLPPLRSPLS